MRSICKARIVFTEEKERTIFFENRSKSTVIVSTNISRYKTGAKSKIHKEEAKARHKYWDNFLKNSYDLELEKKTKNLLSNS